MTLSELGSLGEFISAIAVLITLVYIAIQIRKTQEIATAHSLDAAQQIAINETNLWLTHIELVEKANTGAALTDVELATFSELLMARFYVCFLGFIRARALGQVHKWHAANFAHLLYRNPAAKKLWRELEADHRSNSERSVNPPRWEFTDDVETNLVRFEDRDEVRRVDD